MNAFVRIITAALAVVLLVPSGVFAQSNAVHVTIYNQDFGLVKDVRSVNLTQGQNTLIIDDVAALIQPETVHFTSLTDPGSVTILEQNYQYDLLDPQSVLNKSVGKQVTVTDSEGRTITGTLMNPISWEMATGTRARGTTSARSATPSSLVIQRPDGSIVLNASGQIQINELPEGLVSKPRLVWQIDTSRAGQHSAEVSYLTQGLNWQADYVAVVSADDDAIDLQGWVTLSNNSGTSYRNARLQLVAGDVRRIVEQREMLYDRMDVPRAVGLAQPQFEQEQLFDYHLYTLQRPTDVLDRETKQVTLLEASGVQAEKKYYYDGTRGQYFWRNPGWRPSEQYDTSTYNKVNVTIELTNSTDAGLGMPLPKGIVRVYKHDKNNSLQFVGEDTIDHTPRDEKIRLYVGDAFDVVGERKRTQFRRISDRVTEENFEISVRNRQDKPIEVTVVERVTADWQVLQSSHKWTNPDARTLNFVVDVPANGETKVTYQIRTQW